MSICIHFTSRTQPEPTGKPTRIEISRIFKTLNLGMDAQSRSSTAEDTHGLAAWETNKALKPQLTAHPKTCCFQSLRWIQFNSMPIDFRVRQIGFRSITYTSAQVSGWMGAESRAYLIQRRAPACTARAVVQKMAY
jgi:hypothetical protein